MIKIGKIVNTHGIKGELRVLSNSDFIEKRFEENEKIYIEQKEYIIESYYEHKNFYIIKLKNFDNINDVLKLKNKMIYANKLLNEELAEGEYFNYDLIDLNIYNQDGKKRGKVIEVVDGSAYNYLRIKYNNKTYLIPFNNHFILDVQLNDKIIIQEIEGLIDEN